MDDKPILKKTFYTVAVMLTAWGVFVGTVSTVAVLVTSHVVAGPESASPVSSPAEKPAAPLAPGARPSPTRI